MAELNRGPVPGHAPKYQPGEHARLHLNPVAIALELQIRLGVPLGAGHAGLAHEGGAYGY